MVHGITDSTAAQKPLQGWLLRAVSWVLRTVGVVGTLAFLGTWQAPGWTWKGILLGASFAGVVFTVSGVELSKYARRHLSDWLSRTGWPGRPSARHGSRSITGSMQAAGRRCAG